MTSMWKYDKGVYAYQTDYKNIANNMKRRGYELFNWGLNCDHWVYLAEKKSLKDALSTLKTLTGKSPNFNERNEVWEC